MYTNMASKDLVRIIVIGNPGAGKSCLLNSLAGKPLFKSGVNVGKGLTFKLDEKQTEDYCYVDTPGLADQKLRHQAAEAISVGLKNGGDHKIIFVVTEQMGRVRQQDSTTIKLVHEAAPEIKMNYGVIVNMISKGN